MVRSSLVEADDEAFDWMSTPHPGMRDTLSLPPGGVETPEILAYLRGLARALRAARRPGTWMIVSAGEVVGLCGFKGPPEGGRVEIGYGIASTRRRLGHATRAVGLMLRAAGSDALIEVVTAQTAVANHASARVLEKNGFERVGTRIDREEGEVTLWRRLLSPPDRT